jgi:preprotein translocase subunit YajC
MPMRFIIDNALAENGATPAAATDFSFFIMIGIFFLIMYFMIIRPQSKRAKEHKKLIESLAKGDEVVTNGGLLGKVTEVGESLVQMEISQGVLIKVQKNAVTMVMPKGTMKGD